MLAAERSLAEQAELHLVAHVQGGVDEVFREYDTDRSGSLYRDEIKQVINHSRGDTADVTDAEVDDIFAEIENKVTSWDSKRPDSVSLVEFRIWYGESSERIRDQVVDKFRTIDTDGSGKLRKDEIRELLLSTFGQTLPEEEADSLWEEMLSEEKSDGEDGEISLDEFMNWYFDSKYLTSWLDLRIIDRGAVEAQLGCGGLSFIEKLSLGKSVGMGLVDNWSDFAVMATFYDNDDVRWFQASLSVQIVSGLISGMLMAWGLGHLTEMRATNRGPLGVALGLTGLGPVATSMLGLQSAKVILPPKALPAAVARAVDAADASKMSERSEADAISNPVVDDSKPDHTLDDVNVVGANAPEPQGIKQAATAHLAPAAVITISSFLKVFAIVELVFETLPQSCLQTYIGVSYGEFDPESDDFNPMLVASVGISFTFGGLTLFGLECVERNHYLPVKKKLSALSVYGMISIIGRASQLGSLVLGNSLVLCAVKQAAVVPVACSILLLGGIATSHHVFQNADGTEVHRIVLSEGQKCRCPGGAKAGDEVTVAVEYPRKDRGQSVTCVIPDGVGPDQLFYPPGVSDISIPIGPLTTRYRFIVTNVLHLVFLGCLWYTFHYTEHVDNNYADKSRDDGSWNAPQHFDCRERFGTEAFAVMSLISLFFTVSDVFHDPYYGCGIDDETREKLHALRVKEEAAEEVALEGVGIVEDVLAVVA